MSIYHCSIKIIGRSNGRSAIASSAYRSGTKLHSIETDKTFNYENKSGVVHSEIMLCENAPKEYADRETLWNAVQAKEKNANAQLAREVEVALPVEMTREQQLECVRKYVQENFVDKGMIADWALHDKEDGNPHAHIMLTTRPIKENGEWGAKEKKTYKLDQDGNKIPKIDLKTGEQKIEAKTGRKVWERETVQANDWNDQSKAEEWRKAWADICNKYLLPEQQIDHRSYERQGIDKLPSIHEGAAAREMEKKDLSAERCQINRDIKKVNQLTEILEVQYELTEHNRKLHRENNEERERITGSEGRLNVIISDIRESAEEVARVNRDEESKRHSIRERIHELITNIRRRVAEVVRKPVEEIQANKGDNIHLTENKPVETIVTPQIEFFKPRKSDKKAGFYDHKQNKYFEIVYRGYSQKYPYNMSVKQYDELIDKWETLQKNDEPQRAKVANYIEMQARIVHFEDLLLIAKGKDKREIKAELKALNKELPNAKKNAEGARSFLIQPNPANVLNTLKRYKNTVEKNTSRESVLQKCKEIEKELKEQERTKKPERNKSRTRGLSR